MSIASLPGMIERTIFLRGFSKAYAMTGFRMVAAVPGGAFGPSGEGFLRMCFATAFDQIQIAMERTAKFVERVRRG